MATTSDFKNGLCINHNSELWKIESFQHVKPGKGPAFVRTKIRNLNTSRLLEHTFTAGVKIEIVRVENRAYQFLYQEGNETYHFMNQKNYEQISIQKNMINAPDYLKEGSIVDIMFHAEKELPLSCKLPQNVMNVIQQSMYIKLKSNEIKTTTQRVARRGKIKVKWIQRSV